MKALPGWLEISDGKSYYKEKGDFTFPQYTERAGSIDPLPDVKHRTGFCCLCVNSLCSSCSGRRSPPAAVDDNLPQGPQSGRTGRDEDEPTRRLQKSSLFPLFLLFAFLPNTPLVTKFVVENNELFF